MRASVTDLGMTTTPLSTCHEIATCAADLPCFSPTAARVGFFGIMVPSNVAPLPNGLYAVITMPFFVQNPSRSALEKYGWLSTWSTAGLIVPSDIISVIWLLVKLESPIALTIPFSTSASIARHVSTSDVSVLYCIVPSSFFGNERLMSEVNTHGFARNIKGRLSTHTTHFQC